MWDRRQLLAFLTTTSAAASSRGVRAQPSGAAMPSMPGMSPGTMTAESCIESCWQSHVMCLQTERYCIESGGMHVVQAHLALLSDCAEMCEKTADTLLRRSPQHAAVCLACAQLCDACAGDCETFKDDARMLACARTCRNCAGHCRDMSKLAL